MSVLEVHIPVASEPWSSPNLGKLAGAVLDAKGVGPMVGLYFVAFLDELASHGIRPKGWLQNPWGRWSRVRIHGERFGWTGMRLDQRKLAQKFAPWLDASVHGAVASHGLGVYVGSNPIGGLDLTGLTPFLETGVTFDASAYHFGTVTDDQIRAAHGRGCPVFREANRRHGDAVPCVAKWKPFSRGFTDPERFCSPADAPAGSAMWFATGINTPVEWAWAELAHRAGLRLRVNLRATAQRTRLYRLVGAA